MSSHPTIHSERAYGKAREAILRAGIEQFALRGVSGARTEAIAAQAGVNKALLHYYFGSKDGLYRSVLQTVFAGVLEQSFRVLESEASPGERLLRWHLQHFDRMIVSREYQSLLQQEMIRVRQGKSGILPLLARQFFRPLLRKLMAVVEEGIKKGELCPMEPLQATYSIFGTNAAYFLSAPMMRLAASFEPLSPASLRRRREASLSFLGRALFVDREHGREVANRVLAATPLPRLSKQISVRSKTA